MPFTSKLRVEEVAGGGDTWALTAPLLYVGYYVSVMVPTAYETDYATVPRLLWPLFPKSGRWNKAAVVHDHLITDYLTAREPILTSAQVDEEFRHALKDCNVHTISRWLMWAGVRWAAVANKLRRPGWLKTLPQLLGVTALALVPVAGVVAVLL